MRLSLLAIFRQVERANAVKSAFIHSVHHRDLLERSRRCACFHCLAVFSRREIRRWSDHGQTALCPRCGIDAVLPGAAGLPLRRKYLIDARKHWFNIH